MLQCHDPQMQNVVKMLQEEGSEGRRLWGGKPAFRVGNIQSLRERDCIRFGKLWEGFWTSPQLSALLASSIQKSIH
jgi:hypothetical protein